MKGRGLFQALVVAGFAAAGGMGGAGCEEESGGEPEVIDAAAGAADAAAAGPDAADGITVLAGCGCADAPVSCACGNSPCCWLVEDPCCSVCPP
jgi:hypothetical protein